MRLRLRSIEYQFGGASQSLERYFRDLRDELLRQGQHYGMLHTAGQWRPPVDIHETPETIQIKIELAGMTEDSVEVTLYDNALVVQGNREDDSEHDESICYHEAQVRYGPFRAEILLPAPVDRDHVDASYENGFVRIRLWKAAIGDPHPVQHTSWSSSGASSEVKRELNASSVTGALLPAEPATLEPPRAPLRRIV